MNIQMTDIMIITMYMGHLAIYYIQEGLEIAELELIDVLISKDSNFNVEY